MPKFIDFRFQSDIEIDHKRSNVAISSDMYISQQFWIMKVTDIAGTVA